MHAEVICAVDAAIDAVAREAREARAFVADRLGRLSGVGGEAAARVRDALAGWDGRTRRAVGGSLLELLTIGDAMELLVDVDAGLLLARAASLSLCARAMVASMASDRAKLDAEFARATGGRV